jgi:uncharacterized protein (TIGR00290 family)
MIKAVMNWSGGKDSSLSLWEILKQKEVSVQCLLTTINGANDRISMHGVRTALLEKQAASIGLPLKKVVLPEMPTMSVYDDVMQAAMNDIKQQGVTHSIFGDIFLEDLKAYRDGKLAEAGLQGIYPLWKRDSKELMRAFIDNGFKAVLVCVNEKYLDKSFCGRFIDDDLLKDLPDNVDPCGENGEYHSFVFDGPIFKKSVDFRIGEMVYRNYAKPKTEDDNCHSDSSNYDTGFWYVDLED